MPFRLFIGMLFLPYTGMVLSFTVIGSLLARHVFWDRVAAIMLVYFLALGMGAHALDALASKGSKPWGGVFNRRTLVGIAAITVATAYAIGGYYIVTTSPWLAVIALAEGFFLFAYNLEWFDGQFHTDLWFAASWGALPVLAGYVMQTNALSLPALLLAAAAGLLSLVEIQASRPYKALKRQDRLTEADRHLMQRLERILKALSLGVILIGLALMAARWEGVRF
ncbi:MAG: hypothetical protein ICV75_01545 [Nitrospiraceae bacterium]|nr:hypothetical protein [Nitrospiraceae bacterium]